MEKFVEVREAVKDDCQEIRALIQELADFEEMPDGPKIDYQVLQKDGFDRDDPLFKCYVAVCDNKIVGYALYFYIYSTISQKAIHLEDLYVTPDYRQKHIGSRLFDTVAKQTFAEKCEYLNFSVLGWNPAQDFYKTKGSLDLTEMEGWHMYRLNQDTIKQLTSNYANSFCKVREANLIDFDFINKFARENSNTKKVKEVSLTIEENSIDEDNSFYGYLVAVLNEEVVGYALYCYAYSTWDGKSMYIQEIFTTPGENELNIKRDLLIATVKKAYDNKCNRIDFWILDSKNEGPFYLKNGAIDLTDSEEWHMYRLFELTKKTS